LIESLVVACDGVQITIPPTPRFECYRQEMEAFEYVLDGGEVRYGAPSGMHDDAVFSLALAVRGRQVHQFNVEEWARAYGVKLLDVTSGGLG
jgi:hypothetical protein